MSKCIDKEWATTYYGGNGKGSPELGDKVSFYHDGERLFGEVVRVYNSRHLFHVMVDGSRYEVDTGDDIRVE